MIAEKNNIAAMMAAKNTIGTGFIATALTLVIMAVTKSTSRSSTSGNDTTEIENRSADRNAPTMLPTTRNIRPSVVVKTTRKNSPSVAIIPL